MFSKIGGEGKEKMKRASLPKTGGSREPRTRKDGENEEGPRLGSYW